MTVPPPPETVRQLVERNFDDLSRSSVSAGELDETIHIDEGRYVARSYRRNGMLAMWLIAVGIVQFYDADGQMLRTVNLLEELKPQRMAA
jgi:hypothetical protein